MVEVFKTNVGDYEGAVRLTAAIHKVFETYCATFDLDDCDKILRIECNASYIESSAIIQLLEDHGFIAEVLPEGEIFDPFAKLRRWV